MATILIQEQSQDIQNLYKAIFRQNGIQPVFTQNPDEVIPCLNDCHFDLVIIEHGEPQCSGFELAAEINHSYPLLPLILVSTVNVTAESLSDFLHPCNNFFMRKPFDITRLRRIIEMVTQPVPIHAGVEWPTYAIPIAV